MRITLRGGIGESNGTKTLVQGNVWVSNELGGEAAIPFRINGTKQADGKTRIWVGITEFSKHNGRPSEFYPQVDHKTGLAVTAYITANVNKLITIGLEAAAKGDEVSCDSELKEIGRRRVGSQLTLSTAAQEAINRAMASVAARSETNTDQRPQVRRDAI